MVPIDPRAFLLFARSEPVRGDEGYTYAASFHRLRVFLRLAPSHPAAPARGPSGEPRWEFPADIGRCVRAALELAAETGTSVEVIDVSRAGKGQDLVSRWVLEGTLLPKLVAPDGRALEGVDAFVPSRLRRFFSGR